MLSAGGVAAIIGEEEERAGVGGNAGEGRAEGDGFEVARLDGGHVAFPEERFGDPAVSGFVEIGDGGDVGGVGEGDEVDAIAERRDGAET